MKSLALGALLVLSSMTAAHAAPVFIKSVSNPEWNRNGNQYQMDSVFGAGNWTDSRFETVDPSALFSTTNDFIFMEIGNLGWNEGVTFINSNLALMENWVSGGGSILINGAWNEDWTPGDNLGFGVQSAAASGSDRSRAVDPSHALFNSPQALSSMTWDGSSFRHQALTGALDALIVDAAGNTVLGELEFGAGHAMFGTLTLPFFSDRGTGHPNWSPRPDVVKLHHNIIAYAADQSDQLPANRADVSAPATLALMALGLAGMRRFGRSAGTA
jgi:hypothetical protein